MKTCVLTSLAMLIVFSGCSTKSEVWVGEIRLLAREVEQLFPNGMAYSSENGKRRITVVDLDGHSLSALTDFGSAAEQKALEG